MVIFFTYTVRTYIIIIWPEDHFLGEHVGMKILVKLLSLYRSHSYVGIYLLLH